MIKAPNLSDLWPPRGVVLVLAVLITLPELVLQGADAGWWGSRLWRAQAYTYGGFWAGLLGDWQANYLIQPFAMFFSYSFLHTGLSHLAGNLGVLLWLGHIAGLNLRPPHVLGLYAGAVLGGALAYAALSTSYAPMVGASGAIFGLAGAWVVWIWQDQPDTRAAWITAARMVALVVGLNVVTWVLQDGQLAWETHLGGFVVGAALAWALPRQD